MLGALLCDIIIPMIDYEKLYNDATKKILAQAADVDYNMRGKIDAQYSLYDIAYTLRDSYANPAFRQKFVGMHEFQGNVIYPKGFCALSTICIYELYGGADLWTPSAIHLGAWEHAPVVFLRNNFTGDAFDTTGDQFAPLRVPYELGTPLNRRIQDMRTPNKAAFVATVQQKLDRR